jgi:hypothetical protein
MKRVHFFSLIAISFMCLVYACKKEPTSLEAAQETTATEQTASTEDALSDYVSFAPFMGVEEREPTPGVCCWIISTGTFQSNGQVYASFEFKKPKKSRFTLTLRHVPTGQIVSSLGTFSSEIPNCIPMVTSTSFSELACAWMPEMSGAFTITFAIQVPDDTSLTGWSTCASATSPAVNFLACQ